MKYKKKIREIICNEYFFSIIAQGGLVLLGFIESICLARYLGAYLKGNFSYIYNTTAILQNIITFGIQMAYPYYRKKCNKAEQLINEFMSIIIVLFGVYYIVLVGVSFFVANYNFNIAIICFLLPFMGYDHVVTYIYMIEQPNRTNGFSFLCKCAQLLYIAIIIKMTRANIYLGVLYYIIGSIIRGVYFTRNLDIHFSWVYIKFRRYKELIKFGFMPMLAVLMTTLNYRLDIIMLNFFDSITYSEIGIYSIGIALSEKALLIPDSVKNILLSKLSRGKDENEVALVMRVCFFISTLFALFIQFLGGPLIKYLYGEEYVGADIVSYISVWGTTFMCFFKMISQYNVVHHKQYLNVVFLSVAIGINIVLNLLLIPTWGINGAALATGVGYVISAIIFLLYFNRITKIRVADMIFIKKNDLALFSNK